MIRTVPSLENVDDLVIEHSIDDCAVQHLNPDQLLDLLYRMEYIESEGSIPLVVNQYIEYRTKLYNIYEMINFATGSKLDDYEQAYMELVHEFIAASHEVTVMMATKIMNDVPNTDAQILRPRFGETA